VLKVEFSSGLIRAGSIGAVALSVVLPLHEVVRITYAPDPSRGDGVIALVATAVFLPLHLRHVVYGLRGVRPRGAWWTLGAMAVVILGLLPVIGIGWVTMVQALVVSVFVLVRPPWSLIAVAALLLLPIPLAFAMGVAEFGPYYTTVIAWRSVPYVLIWLVNAVRRLTAAQQELADEAVTRERLRIDDELRRTIGEALASIIARAQRAATAAPDDAEAELQMLLRGSRGTLADARRMIHGYQRESLRTELETAVTLLAAGGIEVTLDLPDEDLAEAPSAGVQKSLRSGVTRLLGDAKTRSCVIHVIRQDGQIALRVAS
jgi:signal transduction histidine kinase